MDKEERYMFDVGKGVNHGAEVCEVWNLFIRKISEICNIVKRLYRHGGLSIFKCRRGTQLKNYLKIRLRNNSRG